VILRLAVLVQYRPVTHRHSAALRGVLGVLQHPGPQFWGPAIGGSGKLVIGVYGACIWHSTRARTSLNAALHRQADTRWWLLPAHRLRRAGKKTRIKACALSSYLYASGSQQLGS